MSESSVKRGADEGPASFVAACDVEEDACALLDGVESACQVDLEACRRRVLGTAERSMEGPAPISRLLPLIAILTGAQAKSVNLLGSESRERRNKILRVTLTQEPRLIIVLSNLK